MRRDVLLDDRAVKKHKAVITSQIRKWALLLGGGRGYGYVGAHGRGFGHG